MLKLNLIKCQDLQSPQLNDNSESKRVANSNCSDIKSMQLKLIDEFSQSVRAKKQRVNNRYSVFENSSDEEEKSEIVRDEAIRHMNTSSVRAPGPSTLNYWSMYGIGPATPQFGGIKIA